MLFVFGTTSGFATPIEWATDSAECKRVIARLLEATDASFDHYSPSGENVFFRNPKSVLSCTSRRHPGISFTWDAGGFPPNEWFGLVAKAGKAVTGSRFERAAISIQSVLSLGTEGQNRISGHRSPEREDKVSGFHA
jgi:hypothetical protein